MCSDPKSVARVTGCVLGALLTLLLMVFASTVHSGSGQDTVDWRSGKLAHLYQYIGTYEYDAVFDDLAVRRSMKALLGENISLFLRNIQARAPIGFEGSGLVLKGLKPHEGDKETAILIVEPYDGEIHAAIMSEGKIAVYSKALKYEHLPIAIRQWVQWQVNHHLFMSEPKADFRWVK